MAQKVVYKKISNHGCVILYRGGYDEETGQGLDPHPRAPQFNRGWNQTIKDGVLISLPDDDNSVYHDRALKFFGLEGRQDEVAEVDLSICFDKYHRAVLFKNSVKYKPKRFAKKVKTRCETFKEWQPYYYVEKKDDAYVVEGWKFKSKDDYLIISMHPYSLVNIIPEYSDVYGDYLLNDWSELGRILWGLEPIDLNSYWGMNEEQLEIVRKKEVKEFQEQKKHEHTIEERKLLPGYCDVCGAEDADYCADPYDEEIYGEENMRWLCSKCYADIMGDI